MKEDNIGEKEIISRKAYIKKFILYFVIIVAVIYIIYSIYTLIISPTDVFMVENGKVTVEEDAVGYIIRDEEIVQGENYKNGIVQIKAEGEKTAKGEAIFRYYSNGEDKLIQKIQELDEKIQEALNKESNLFSSDIATLDKEIENKLNDVYKENSMQKIEEYKKDIANAITKKAKIAGELSPSGSTIKKLIEERSSYENKLNSGSEYVKAPNSGIVSYRVDGLENVLTPEKFDSLNEEFFNGLNLKIGQIISTNYEKGKVIDNFKCYIATVMDNDKIHEVKTGNNIKIRLSSAEEVPATIEYTQEQGEKTLLVIKITRCVEELINYRKISFDIIFSSNSGFKVPNSSIIEENGLKYVVRNRAGYLDKILVKIKEQNDTYSIIGKYAVEELKDLGFNSEEIIAMKNITLYDEILVKPDTEKIK